MNSYGIFEDHLLAIDIKYENQQIDIKHEPLENPYIDLKDESVKTQHTSPENDQKNWCIDMKNNSLDVQYNIMSEPDLRNEQDNQYIDVNDELVESICINAKNKQASSNEYSLTTTNAISDALKQEDQQKIKSPISNYSSVEIFNHQSQSSEVAKDSLCSEAQAEKQKIKSPISNYSSVEIFMHQSQSSEVANKQIEEKKEVAKDGLCSEAQAEKVFRCTRCCYETNKPRNMARHISIRHKFMCSICNYDCDDRYEFNMHSLAHSNAEVFECIRCGYRCSLESDLCDHLSTHVADGTAKDDLCSKPQVRIRFRCSLCSYKTNKPLHFAKHLSTRYKLKCPECNFESRNKCELNKHLLTHSDSKEFNCYKCSYECNLESDLTNHLLTHLVFKCHKCRYECNLESDLNDHITTHSNSDNRQQTSPKLWKCSMCSYECKDEKVEVQIHLQTHSDVKVFKCDDCSYECNETENFKSHLVTHHHEEVGNRCKLKKKIIPLLKCSKCSFECKQQWQLTRHSLHHVDTKLFKCSLCKYETVLEHCYTVHLLSHASKYAQKKKSEAQILRNYNNKTSYRKIFPASSVAKSTDTIVGLSSADSLPTTSVNGPSDDYPTTGVEGLSADSPYTSIGLSSANSYTNCIMGLPSADSLTTSFVGLSSDSPFNGVRGLSSNFPTTGHVGLTSADSAITGGILAKGIGSIPNVCTGNIVNQSNTGISNILPFGATLTPRFFSASPVVTSTNANFPGYSSFNGVNGASLSSFVTIEPPKNLVFPSNNLYYL